MVNIPLFTEFYTSQVVIAGLLNHHEYYLLKNLFFLEGVRFLLSIFLGYRIMSNWKTLQIVNPVGPTKILFWFHSFATFPTKDQQQESKVSEKFGTGIVVLHTVHLFLTAVSWEEWCFCFSHRQFVSVSLGRYRGAEKSEAAQSCRSVKSLHMGVSILIMVPPNHPF